MIGCPKLYVHLSVLFNLFLSHYYLPPAFVQSTIVPLVKLKNGNLCDVNNYRAITLSNAVTKILESLFLPLLNRPTHVDD